MHRKYVSFSQPSERILRNKMNKVNIHFTKDFSDALTVSHIETRFSKTFFVAAKTLALIDTRIPGLREFKYHL